MDLRVDCYISIEIDKNVITEEVMNNYERYFYRVGSDSDFDEFDTQFEKHSAYIARCILRGEANFIEGYGKVKDFVKELDVYTTSRFTTMYKIKRR
jgi:hypothetical protein